MSGLAHDLRTVARFSDRDDQITRLAWSPAHVEAMRWMVGEATALGLDAGIDAAGNVVARWGPATGPALAVGSHLDSVPDAGRLDGVLGVLAALAAVRRLQAQGFTPRRPVWVIAFMDEEGARFGTPLFGSRAFVGEDLEPSLAAVDADGVSIADAMRKAGFTPDRLGDACAIDRVGAYLELHIEQGPVLEKAGADIGVVRAISGGAVLAVGFTGHAGHAGTVPMDMRRDALVGGARAIVALRDAALGGGDLRITVGRIAAHPGGTNVIPGGCELSVDIRSADPDALDRGRDVVGRIVERIASEEGLQGSVRTLTEFAPLQLDETIIATVARAAAAESAVALDVVSGAGHDALVIGRAVPAGMIFVPSRNGISHHPEEATSADQCELGERVLARAIRALAGQDTNGGEIDERRDSGGQAGRAAFRPPAGSRVHRGAVGPGDGAAGAAG
ncbi:M20 family metallo-hydrolase [Capillimicrobium parvum]|uniref:Allantoate amidohydrolase n=1 Tax=Capillimicrobium parvum TaxID=2884022 RepID=A0A9E7BZN6_9ACTN|nr:M20 family metallo-hydrolase [Capillimicrobium parvum]UGS34528.1 Allantoate amidohydrolase [Capillimicrobium parvum]